jgi:hypothetical protein
MVAMQTIAFGTPVQPVAVNTATPAMATIKVNQNRLVEWLRSQFANAERGTLLIRSFVDGEFGKSSASPSSAHIHATNRLMVQVRQPVTSALQSLKAALLAAIRNPQRAAIDLATRAKDEANNRISAAEKIWHFYWLIFNQRNTDLGAKLLAADRIALDCYQYVYQGLGRARHIPSPAPFSYVEAGLGPATYRRGVRLSKLGMFHNPFPLVKLPDHRLVCPWTLGAIPHEVAHNLQSDLGLWLAVPKRMAEMLKSAGLNAPISRVWLGWQKEIFADLMGVLLIGPAYLPSLMDVVGKSKTATVQWSDGAVHPTPFLRVLINLELLKRLGFTVEAREIRRAWLLLYPVESAQPIPFTVRKTFKKAATVTVDAICDTKYPQLGDRTLRQVIAFRPQDQIVAVEAAHRLARGADPGIIPERFMLASVRYAFDKKLATPAILADNFFKALGRR